MLNVLSIKVFVVLIIDFILGGLSLNISNYIRLGYQDKLNIETLVACLLLPIIFFIFGIYKRSWKYFSITDLWSLVKACLIANIFLFLIVFIFNRLENIPRLVTILNFFTLTFLTGGTRIVYRTLFEKFSFLGFQPSARIPVLLISSVDNADYFIRIAERRNSVYKVLGIVVDESQIKKEFLIRSTPILGAVQDIELITEKLHKDKNTPQKIIIISNNIKGSDMSNIMKLADARGMTVGRAPVPNELIEGSFSQTSVRDISLEDLLGRRQNKLEYSKVKNFLSNQIVLISGAGGSIGSELARRINEFHPKKMLLLDISEQAIYNLSQKFIDKTNSKAIQLFCSNVSNKSELEKIFKKYRPSIIYHAAAMKHVNICEENASEAIRTNTIATDLLSNLAEKHKSKCLILVSTDKAVNPTSVMGATKKLAESIIQSRDRFSNSGTRFITVRFGNVLGSQGSVVPLFQKQISHGGPITVTNKNVSRFFMTIEEAVALVLNATLEQYNSKLNMRGCISVLNMGASIKIDILAKQMIKLAGMTPNKEIKIKYIGLKRGEKLHEALYAKEEKKIDLGDKGFFLVKSKIYEGSDISKKLDILKKICDYSNNDVKKNLFRLIKK